ncbi:hypothetical protein TrST_g10135 [Triparma strigata]|uniref:Uncharacterized protein n=1 Tax=Triparma strigata TaxID=1606541 RepID=A0A9W7E432_9STRA|nr:hypothetical protein TrST_g10135 [Triparma strigata]
MPSTAPTLPPPSSFIPSAHRSEIIASLQSTLTTSFALLLCDESNLFISSTSGLRRANLDKLLRIDKQENEENHDGDNELLEPRLLQTQSAVVSPLPSYDCIADAQFRNVYSASSSGINIFTTSSLLESAGDAHPIHTFQTHPSPFEKNIEVNSLYLSPTTSTLYSACGDLFGLYAHSTSSSPKFIKNIQPTSGYLHCVTGSLEDSTVAWGGEDGTVWVMDEREEKINPLNVRDYIIQQKKASKSQHIYVLSILIKAPFMYISGGVESPHTISQSGYVTSVYLPSSTFLNLSMTDEPVNRLRMIDGEVCSTGRDGGISRWSAELKVCKEGKGEGEGWDLAGWKGGIIKCGGRGEVFEDFRICGYID